MPRKAKIIIEEPVQSLELHKVEEKKEKKKRNINPDTMTYIKALSIWKKENGHKGISPKKGTKEYDQIMKIMKDHKKE